MSKIQHVLFDCDGVLVDTEYTAAVKMTEALKNAGVDLLLEYYLQNLSGSTFSSIVETYLGNTIAPEAAVELIAKVENEVAAEVKLVAGVKELLLGSPLPKSVVSNSSVHTVEHALAVTGVRKFFAKEIFSSELVSNPKPAADVYHLALSTLGYDATEIIVIEDSINGAKAALAAGLVVVGFTGASHIQPGHGQNLLNLGIEQITDNMAGLHDILSGYSS
jgi:HAD superfamily hydrolase (TIGR01509 family)